MSDFDTKLTLLFEYKSLIAKHLPFELPLISFDLAVTVLKNANDGTSLKILYATLPYSPMGIRNHYLKFMNEGLIITKQSSMDKRVKLIYPSERLTNLFTKMFKEFSAFS